MWMASATPDTLSMRYRPDNHQHHARLRHRKTYLGRGREHSFGRIQSSTTRLLDLFNLSTGLPNDGPHARVGNDELDSNGAATRNGGNIERFVVNSAHDEPKCLKSLNIIA